MKLIRTALTTTFLLASTVACASTSHAATHTNIRSLEQWLRHESPDENAEIRSHLPLHLKDSPLVLLGIRGYSPIKGSSRNERLYFDDIIAVITPDFVRIYPASLDPTGFGFNSHPLAMKSYASLDSNRVYSYKLGVHHPPMGTPYAALVQAGPVHYSRDNKTNGVAGSSFNIHKAWPIHAGSLVVSENSSWGCQVVVSEEWDEFYSTVVNAVQTAEIIEIPYLIVEGPKAGSVPLK